MELFQIFRIIPAVAIHHLKATVERSIAPDFPALFVRQDLMGRWLSGKPEALPARQLTRCYPNCQVVPQFTDPVRPDHQREHWDDQMSSE
jgi:hypothetical protein